MCLIGTKPKQKRIVVIGAGSGGSAVIEMLWRAGANNMYPYIIDIIDPDLFEWSNLSRHVLRENSLGLSNAKEMAKLYRVAVTGYQEKFNVLPPDVDVICSCVDSLACESQINAYALSKNIPVVFAGVHGAAEAAEIITVVPGETPCYECWTREGELPPPSTEKYTNPDYDPTKSPSMPGLWCDVLMAASLQVQAVLGVLGTRKKMAPLVLMSLRYPFKTETYNQKERCAVCSDNMEGLRI